MSNGISSELGASFFERAEALLEVVAALEYDADWLLARSSALENRGFELVAQFESQRLRVMEAQARLHTAEVAEDPSAVSLRAEFCEEEERKARIWAALEAVWEESRRCLRRAHRKGRDAERARSAAERLLAQARLLGEITASRREAS
jgi:hypothetical protein